MRCQRQTSGATTSATRLSYHIRVSRQLASKLLAVASQSLAILPDMSEEVSAHQAVRTHVDLSLGCLPGRDWKRCPGRPNNRWVDQVRNDTGNMPSTLWRSAILRGYSAGVTQRPSLATRTWWWWWWWWWCLSVCVCVCVNYPWAYPSNNPLQTFSPENMSQTCPLNITPENPGCGHSIGLFSLDRRLHTPNIPLLSNFLEIPLPRKSLSLYNSPLRQMPAGEFTWTLPQYDWFLPSASWVPEPVRCLLSSKQFRLLA